VYVNEPDLILFVGEALVGNEAVDQLKKFNRVRLLPPNSYIHTQQFIDRLLRNMPPPQPNPA